MTVPEASRHQPEIPPEIQSLLASIADARLSTVPARRIVKAIFWLQDNGLSGKAERLIAHLVTEKHGYLGIIRGNAVRWKKSGHNGFDADDLVQEALLKITKGLQSGQRSALNWSSFCHGRFKDGKGHPDLNGHRGDRAKVDKAFNRIRTARESALPQLEVLKGASAPATLTTKGTPDPESAPAQGRPEQPSKQQRIEREILNLLSIARARLDPESQIADDDLESWGREILDGIIDGIPEDDVRRTASEMFCDDPPQLTGGPDDAGRPSLEMLLGLKGHQVKYRLKNAKVYVAERLLKDYIEGPGLNENDAVERAWLRDWYNRHLT